MQMELSLRYHPKLLALAEATNTSRMLTYARIGHLLSFMLEFARDGDLSRFTAKQITGPLEIPAKDAEAFVAALHETGWLDPDGHWHDWWEHTGHYVRSGDAAKERAAASRRAAGAKPRGEATNSHAQPADVAEDPVARGEAGMTPHQRRLYAKTRAALAHSLETGGFDGTHGYFEGRQDEPRDTIGMSQVQYEFEIAALLQKGREQFGRDAGDDEGAQEA